MNKSDLIAAIATMSGLTKVEANKALSAFIESITSTLKSGKTVTLIGFGTFKISHRSARTGRNPRTGKELKIAARKSPSFTAGKALKDAVN